MLDLFHRNPRLLILTLLLIAVGGVSAFDLLPRREDPELVERFALVLTPYPGAATERVEALVTAKLERRLREIEEIRIMESSSLQGLSTIRLELDDRVGADQVGEVWSRIRDKLADTVPELPREAAAPRLEEMELDAYAMIAALVWNGPGPPNRAVLQRLAEDLADRLRAGRGTAKVELVGTNPEELLAEVDPARLADMGLTPADVARAIATSDAKLPGARVIGPTTRLLLELDGELDTPERVRRTPIALAADGRTVRLGELATVRKTIADPPRELALIDGKAAVALGVRMASGQRVDRWATDVRALLEVERASLPPVVTLETIFDQSGYTERRLDGLFANLGLGALCVLAVVLLLMGWQSALVVSSALPLAVLMVLGGMRLMDIPLHQMSVTGLIIALGLLIDNAIVVVDEVRHRQAGGADASAAVSGTSRTLAVPLLGSTLTTTLAFMPIVLLPGPAGEFVGSIALSVILAITASLGLSLTILPALAARLPAPRASARRWWRDGLASGGLLRVYRRSLDGLLARPLLGVLIAALLPMAGFAVAHQLPEQFFPPADRDQFPIDLRLPASTSIAETRRVALAVREHLLKDEGVTRVHWFIGRSAPKFYYNMIEDAEGVPFYAQAYVQLRSAEGATARINRLQRELDAAFPRAQLLVRQLEQGPPFAAPIELRVSGPDPEVLHGLGEQLRARLALIPGVTHTRATLRRGQPRLRLTADEVAVRQAGLDPARLATTLRASLDGVTGGSVIEATEQLPVRVRARRSGTGDPGRVADLTLVSPAGPLPLSALGRLSLDPVLAELPRYDGRRITTVQGFLTAGTLPATVLAPFQAAIADVALPAGYTLQFGGEAAERDDAVGGLMASVGLLAVMMAATLVLSFNSFRMAGIIGVVAALCVGLPLLALWSFGFMAIIGTMGLIGVAINDSIVVLAALRAEPAARAADPAAIRDVVVRSTRHVLATTLTTIAGFMPLLIDGGQFWPPLAIAIAGGVAGATLLALYLVPALFVWFARRDCARCALTTTG